MKSNTECKTAPRLLLRWLPVNQAWTMMYGDALISIGGDRRKLWQHLSEVSAILAKNGLALHRVNAQCYEVIDNPNKTGE